MFDQTPVQERHAAIGVFTAIALAGAGALHLLITGGFAPLSPRIERTASAESVPLAVRVVDAEWAQPTYASSARVTPTSYTPDNLASPEEPLAGAETDREPGAGVSLRTQDDVARDIEALYAATDSYGDDAYFEDASYLDDDAAFEDEQSAKDASASESASPW